MAISVEKVIILKLQWEDYKSFSFTNSKKEGLLMKGGYSEGMFVGEVNFVKETSLFLMYHVWMYASFAM